MKINKSIYQDSYTLDLNKYLQEGKNNIEILILYSNEFSEKTVRITNEIKRKENLLEVTKKDYKITP